ncbi:MAG: hypothetical protein R2723_01070 [Microbacterium sp.]
MNTPPADRLALATRGEARDDGSVLVHVVDTTSPHRAIVVREPDGALRAGSAHPPLWRGWAGLYVPASVIAPADTAPAGETNRALTTHAAALLDMDGTLVDSHAVVERLWTGGRSRTASIRADPRDHPRASGAGLDGAVAA